MRYAWLWLADMPLMALSAYAAAGAGGQRAAECRGQAMPALLRVLFIGFAWLPIAVRAVRVQSLWLLDAGEFMLGRAPAHALFIGFFGSLLVAMVTRVTQGHSGRPLELGWAAAFAFVVIQRRGSGAHRRRTGAGHIGLAERRRTALAARVPAVGAALGLHLPDAARGRQGGLR